MDAFANALIDALGGTREVHRLTKAGVSTVHNWRRAGLSPSRLDHLVRVARDERPEVPIAAIAAEHGVTLGGDGGEADHVLEATPLDAVPSSGNLGYISTVDAEPVDQPARRCSACSRRPDAVTLAGCHHINCPVREAADEAAYRVRIAAAGVAA